MRAKPSSVDEYIASFPPGVQDKLRSVRDAVRRGAPGTEEAISYGIPTLKLAGRYVIYFAGWKDHISVYPIPELDDALAAEVSPYQSGKGTLKFSLAEPIPTDLIERLAARALAQRKAGG
jgi:uncharacterized protein YdhG (YjbR/CyaY superfamily)